MTTPEFRLIAEVFLYSVGFIQVSLLQAVSCELSTLIRFPINIPVTARVSLRKRRAVTPLMQFLASRIENLNMYVSVCFCVQAATLSRKIVQSYKLCAEQLSSLNHYDYGMRAVRAVLDAATKIKMTHEEDDEDKIILKAILDVNLPKFSSSDTKLFQVELFPKTLTSSQLCVCNVQ